MKPRTTALPHTLLVLIACLGHASCAEPSELATDVSQRSEISGDVTQDVASDGEADLLALDGSPSPDIAPDTDPGPDTDTDTGTDAATDSTHDGLSDTVNDLGPDLEPTTDVDGDALNTDGNDTSDAPDADAEVMSDVPPAPPEFLNNYPLSAQFPESGAYDPIDHVFYVGSLQDGSIHRINAATGQQQVLFTPVTPGSWWTLGMTVDAERRRLWVCAMDDRSDLSNEDQPYDGYVWIFDLDSGERVANHDLSEAFATAACTDVAVTQEGVGYVCDREHPNVYEVDEVGGATLFASDDTLNGAVVGQNALVVLPDQSALLVAVYLPSKLVRVDLTTAAVQQVDIDGSFFDASFLSGADGMTLREGSAYVVFSSELVRVTPTLGDWATATADEVTVPKGMTDVLNTPNGLYLLNGQAIAYGLGQTPDAFQLTLYLGNL